MTGTSTVEVTVEVSEPKYDGFQALLDAEARDALGKGDFGRALWLFSRLLHIDPYDVRALRESGRIAHALGECNLAAGTLRRVDELDGTVPDPEIHYLRAECLLALGKKDEGWKEFARVEQELGDGPHDRRATLWLARIAVLRSDLDKAVRLYESLLEKDHPDSATYAEVLMYEVDAYIQGAEWATAEKLLRDFLRDQPTNPRGRALLAWVLESRGKVDEELALRAELANEKGDRPQQILAHARALERANDYSGALGRYREAQDLGVKEAADGIRRIERRYRPELGGGFSMQNDPSGTLTGWLAGAAVPIGSRLRLAVSSASQTSAGGLGMNERSSTALSGWGVVTARRGAVVGLGSTVRLDSERAARVGGSAIVQTSPLSDVQLQVRGDANVPWRESASTFRDDGVQDTVGAQLYLKSSISERRILASVGAQARRLALEPRVGLPTDKAVQLFGSAGIDVTLTKPSARAVRGESFENEMLATRGLASAAVVSYRHYELSSDDPFGARLVLVERSSIDEVSGVVRRVFDRKGIVGGELRAGVGYDWVRYVQQWRAGASLLVAGTNWSRLTLDYDVASESGTGLSGRRHLGSVVFHVDL